MVRLSTVNRDIPIRALFLVDINFSLTSVGSKQGAIILPVNTLLMTSFILFSHVVDGLAYVEEAPSGRYYSIANKLVFDRVYNSLFAWGTIMAVVPMPAYVVEDDSSLMLSTNGTAVVQSAKTHSWWAVMIPIVSIPAFVYDGTFTGPMATRGVLVPFVVSILAFFALYLVM